MFRTGWIAATALLLAFGPAAGQQPVFDPHVHLHRAEASVRQYQEQVKQTGRPLAGFGAMWFGGPNQAPAGQIEQTRASNDALMALAAKTPGMLPIVTVHPYDGPSAITELERVAARGARVLKIHAHTQKFDVTDPRVLTLVRRAGELGMVVMMENANILPGDSENLFNLALACPKTKFLFAHLGGLNFRFWNILALARTAENLFANNIYFDISGPLTLAAGSPIQDEFVWTVRNVGIDHVLLASDFPQVTPSQALAAFDKLGFSEEEKAKISHGNARALFGLK